MSTKETLETRTYSERVIKNAQVESMLLVLFGPRPSGGGGRVGRWHTMRNLARYIMDGKGQERALTEIKFNWSAKEGLTPDKAEELAHHLIRMTGPHGEVVCTNVSVGHVVFLKWVFGMETTEKKR